MGEILKQVRDSLKSEMAENDKLRSEIVTQGKQINQLKIDHEQALTNQKFTLLDSS
jgi:hypothetical protein